MASPQSYEESFARQGFIPYSIAKHSSRKVPSEPFKTLKKCNVAPHVFNENSVNVPLMDRVEILLAANTGPAKGAA
jgi:hypothetical protein